MKKYNTIVIDPPYNISLTGKVKREENRRNKLPYKTMTIEEIKNIPISNLLNQGGHLYLWVTNKNLKQGFELLEHWKIRFHLCLVMVKPSGICPSMGYVFGTEFCLLGIKSKPMQKFKSIGKLNWFKNLNKKGEHSKKPNKFYDLVEIMSHEPYLDMFARRRRKGWYVFGDEVKGSIIINDLLENE